MLDSKGFCLCKARGESNMYVGNAAHIAYDYLLVVGLLVAGGTEELLTLLDGSETTGREDSLLVTGDEDEA
ncbi:MAG: hypothetical protein RR246_00125 [Clostridia bacterium]